MKLILLQDVKNLGKKGAVVDVADGYARNFLLPRKLAEAATEGHLRLIDKEKADQSARAQREEEKARQTASELGQTPVVVKVKVGEGGRLFGSVTGADVAAALGKLLGGSFDKRKIQLSEPIKKLGVHPVKVKLHPRVTATLQVDVQPDV
ncbi:MAG: 50S ribosomal protein L9 [Candidatus Eremiobacterota bacterium]